ncbi:ABC transporter substrate-binding protein [Colwellia sp. BRX10-3]|uniref:substrate-binding periplasmic protein n=1 Tax=Colwellia sp. BRX10-3 TaxID=2759844 RepID=UPI0021755639|nr:transporter substrate-binding domain-containing protein [Colwellia sp. BRX10-3]
MKSLVITSAVLLFSFSSLVSASEKITVAFGEKLAPWVLSETNEGIIVDIIEAAMTPLGYEIEHLYLPYARRTKSYKAGGVDVVSDVNLNTIQGHSLKGYLSDTAYSYENFAFSLHNKNFNFRQISDLKNYSLLSWQDAAIHLGATYAEMANNNPQYSETFDQSVQVKLLFLDKVEVIQMDVNIFDYYRAKAANSDKIDTTQKVDRFALFGASPNGFLFKSEAMRDKFNTQLQKLKATGKYQKIFDRYLTADTIEKIHTKESTPVTK